jgi:hypothetical protein
LSRILSSQMNLNLMTHLLLKSSVPALKLCEDCFHNNVEEFNKNHRLFEKTDNFHILH